MSCAKITTHQKNVRKWNETQKRTNSAQGRSECIEAHWQRNAANAQEWKQNDLRYPLFMLLTLINSASVSVAPHTWTPISNIRKHTQMLQCGELATGRKQSWLGYCTRGVQTHVSIRTTWASKYTFLRLSLTLIFTLCPGPSSLL